MKKYLFVAVIMMALVVSGCNSNVVTPTTVSVQNTAVPTAMPTIVIEPTVVPTSAPVQLYEVEIDFEYNPSVYGEYSINWRMVESQTGSDRDIAWAWIHSKYQELKDVCPIHYYAGNNKQGMFVDNVGDIWTMESLSPACVSTLEKLSGTTGLQLPDQTLDDPRVVQCSGNCEVVTDDLIKEAKANLRNTDVIAKKDNQYFSVQENRTRVEPNLYKYPGFGMKYDFPTRIVMHNNSRIEEIGISFDGTEICYQKAIEAIGEMDVMIPEITEVCENEFSDDAWDYYSTAKIDGMYFTWYFKPEIIGKTAILNIVDIQITRFNSIPEPDMEKKEIENLHYRHETGIFVNGEEVLLKDLYLVYYPIQQVLGWETWIVVSEAAIVQKNDGSVVTIHAPIEYACNAVECSSDGQKDQIGGKFIAEVNEKGELEMFKIIK